MYRPALLFFLLGLAACSNDDNNKTQKTAAGPDEAFGVAFAQGTLPYQLSDTGLGQPADTTSIPAAAVSALYPDSLKKQYFGKTSAVRYTPIAKLVQEGKETYYLVHAAAGQKKGALLFVFDAKNQFLASTPFLLPDADPNTTQTAVLDKKFILTKSVTQREGAEVTGEGKQVLAYDASTKSFGLIMEEALLDNPKELVNPLDTFAKTNKLAGDYYTGKKNLVAVRDGRHANQLLVYIHTENESGDCIGQLKGEFIITSSTTAAFRQPGDPCVLGLTFKGNTVTLAEQSGCGNYRGLNCPLSGTFTRKKPQSAKPTTTKPKRK